MKRKLALLILRLLLKLKLIDYINYPSGISVVEEEGVLQGEYVVELSWIKYRNTKRRLSMN